MKCGSCRENQASGEGQYSGQCIVCIERYKAWDEHMKCMQYGEPCGCSICIDQATWDTDSHLEEMETQEALDRACAGTGPPPKP